MGRRRGGLVLTEVILVIIIAAAIITIVWLVGSEFRFKFHVIRAAHGEYTLTPAELQRLMESADYDVTLRKHPSLVKTYPQLIPEWRSPEPIIPGVTTSRTLQVTLSDGRTVPVMVTIPDGSEISSVTIMPDMVERPPGKR